MNDSAIVVEPIGRVHTCYPEKFGIPRQPGVVIAATGWVEFFPPFDREELYGGLDRFSHIWLIFQFHATVLAGWRSTVRPPRLGGQHRVGVYASRSPHRPNHLGMSVVRLDEIVVVENRVRLQVSGVDLLDGTPVLDIKPYVPYADSVLEADDGYASQIEATHRITFTAEAELFCRHYSEQRGRDLQGLIHQTLRHDPRPASQRSTRREYGMLLWDVNVRWRVSEAGFEVFLCEQLTLAPNGSGEEQTD